MVFGIYTITLILPDRWRVLGLFLIYGLLSIIVFVDLVHFRYFCVSISIYSTYSAGQVSAVGDSVKSLVKPGDIFLFIDIPIVALVFWIKKIVIKASLRNERIIAFITSILMVF